jgi:hypothetical protein
VIRVQFVGETSHTEFPNHSAQFIGDWLLLISKDNGALVTQVWPSRVITKVDVIGDNPAVKKVDL